MNIQKSAEDYLETIFVLGKSQKNVRSIDVAKSMGFSKPSVSIAMKKLMEAGYIEIGSGGYIKLLDKGSIIAETIFERHLLISQWLISLGVDATTAVSDACKMEHNLSEDSFSAIKKFLSEKL